MALQDASLELGAGEILALLGPNGAEKRRWSKIGDGAYEGRRKWTSYMISTATPRRFATCLATFARHGALRLRLSDCAENPLFRRCADERGRSINRSKTGGYFDFHANLTNSPSFPAAKQTVVTFPGCTTAADLPDEPTKWLDPPVAKGFALPQAVRPTGTQIASAHLARARKWTSCPTASRLSIAEIPESTPDDLKPPSALPSPSRSKNRSLRRPARIEGLDTVLFAKERNDHWIAFGVSDAMLGAEAIIRVLRADNVHARFRHHTVSLEDAFVHHIGELSEKFDH